MGSSVLSKELLIGVGVGICIAASSSILYSNFYGNGKHEAQVPSNDDSQPEGQLASNDVEPDCGREPIVGDAQHRAQLPPDDVEPDSSLESILDGVVLFAPDDEEIAETFIQNMKTEFTDINLKLETIDYLIPPGHSVIQGYDGIYNATRFVFVFITRTFQNDRFMRYLNDINLLVTLKRDEYNNRLIPVHDEAEVGLFSLCTMTPLRYYDYKQGRETSNFRKVFRKLILNGRQTHLAF